MESVEFLGAAFLLLLDVLFDGFGSDHGANNGVSIDEGNGIAG